MENKNLSILCKGVSPHRYQANKKKGNLLSY